MNPSTRNRVLAAFAASTLSVIAFSQAAPEKLIEAQKNREVQFKYLLLDYQQLTTKNSELPPPPANLKPPKGAVALTPERSKNESKVTVEFQAPFQKSSATQKFTTASGGQEQAVRTECSDGSKLYSYSLMGTPPRYSGAEVVSGQAPAATALEGFLVFRGEPLSAFLSSGTLKQTGHTNDKKFGKCNVFELTNGERKWKVVATAEAGLIVSLDQSVERPPLTIHNSWALDAVKNEGGMEVPAASHLVFTTSAGKMLVQEDRDDFMVTRQVVNTSDAPKLTCEFPAGLRIVEHDQGGYMRSEGGGLLIPVDINNNKITTPPLVFAAVGATGLLVLSGGVVCVRGLRKRRK